MIDYALTLAVCAAIPLSITDPELIFVWNAQQAIVATAIVGFAATVPARIALPSTALIVATYAWGTGSVVDWQGLPAMASLPYFAIVVAMSVVLRMAPVRVMAAADRVHGTCWQDTVIRKRMAEEARRYEQELFALLHDTAASMLMLVGNGTPIPPDRLAAQAKSAIAALTARPTTEPPAPVELVAALSEIATGARTPARFNGLSQLWLDEELGTAVIAAAREAINNVDRHARATEIFVEFTYHRVVVRDNGKGFRLAAPERRHGVAQSIVGRMKRAGGNASIHSYPGYGTTVELSWPDEARCERKPESDDEWLCMLERIRTQYGYLLIAWALLTVILIAPYSITPVAYPDVRLGLAVLAALSCLAVLLVLRTGHNTIRWLAVAVLFVVSVAQPAFVQLGVLAETSQWSLWTPGWCLSALLLGLPLRTAVAVLAANWVSTFAVILAGSPSGGTLVELALVGAHFGVVQIFTQIAYRAITDTLVAEDADVRTHLNMVARQRVSAALDARSGRRHAEISGSLLPLLTEFGRGAPIDSRLRQQANAECQHIRTLLDHPGAFDHPLLRALRPVVDAGINRNVNVELHVQSELPEIGEEETKQLTETISRHLGRCPTSVRIVLTTDGNEFVMSVVCRGHGYNKCPQDEGAATAGGKVEIRGKVETLAREDITWVTIRHPIQPAPPDDIAESDHVFLCGSGSHR